LPDKDRTVPVPDLTDRSLGELVSLRGRSAVVTGGAKGLGRAISRRLAEAGASVVIGDVDAAGAKTAADELAAAFGGACVATELDVIDPRSVAETADTAVTAFGGIDIWVNNAGVYPSTPVLEMSLDEWDHVLGTNLRGTFIGCQEAARRMVRAGHGGVIVNLSSVAGTGGRGPGVTHYVASKHGVIGITRQLALELADHGIRVLAVAPTTIITPGVEAAMGTGRDLEQAITRPLGRAGRPDDVARVVLFCASDLSIFMTGSTLMVDAGETAR
jgi:NAD(P)-dependent dehydrogenase (short-subunit alcohol dehydrogenase family)